MLAQSLKGVTFTTVGAQYLCMHVVVVGTPGRSTTLNMGRCQVKMGGLVNDTTPEPRHPTEAESIPPGFTRHDRKTPEEQEAVSKYRTPAEEDASHGAKKKLTIDEELGAEDVTTLGNDWFPPSESEVTKAVQNLQTPMDVDQAPEEHPYQFFDVDEADALGPYHPPGSPVTAEEDRTLDTPGGFSRAPGDGRPPSRCVTRLSGRRITGRTKE